MTLLSRQVPEKIFAMTRRCFQLQLPGCYIFSVFFVFALRTCLGAAYEQSDSVSKTSQLGTALRPNKVSDDNSTKNENAAAIAALESSLTIITHSMFEKNHRFCKLKGVCRTGDGTVLVPRWMESYSEHISKCGLERVSYLLVDKKQKGKNFTSVFTQGSGITLNDGFRDLDVLGNKAPRGEPGLLVTDLTPSIFLMDLFSRPGMYSKITVTLCTTKGGTICKPENYSDPSVLHPLMFIDSRVADTQDFRWPKSLLRLMRNSVGGALQVSELKDLYGWRVRSEASCFRSIISTSAIASELPPQAFLQSHIFFSKNKLNRWAVNALSVSHNTCSAKVLILNRYGKRFIEGSDKLVSAISSLGQEFRRRDPRIVIQPEVVFFDNSSFHEQVSIMQETSVVVASHGDENTNFMFLRPMARAFEILPFGLSSSLYKNLSTTYGSIYSNVVAQPDEDVFLACVEHFNPKDSEEKENFVAAWKLAAQHFREETFRKKANIESDYAIPEDGDDEKQAIDQRLKRLHQCASCQRISIDSKHLAKTVTKAAARQCNFKGDIDFLST